MQEGSVDGITRGRAVLEACARYQGHRESLAEEDLSSALPKGTNVAEIGRIFSQTSYRFVQEEKTSPRSAMD